MDFSQLYSRRQSGMEDFWSRKATHPVYSREVRLFGRLARLSSNLEGALAAVAYSLPQYSSAPPTDDPPFVIQLIVQEKPAGAGPPPEDLDRFLRYAGADDWLNVQLGHWGSCHVQMDQGWAVAVLSPQLAARPDLVSRYLLNTIFTNLFTRNGFAMLHATGLIRDGSPLLLMAPHGSGKSTTALRLILGGYKVISDSMIYVAERELGLQLTGFPVGRIKLRRDMLREFPQMGPHLTPENVRDEVKFTLDLRQVLPDRVHHEAVYPARLDLCILSRGAAAGSQLIEAETTEVWEAIMENSLHYDAWPVWEKNLNLIEKLVARSRCYRLVVGTDEAGILSAVDCLR